MRLWQVCKYVHVRCACWFAFKGPEIDVIIKRVLVFRAIPFNIHTPLWMTENKNQRNVFSFMLHQLCFVEKCCSELSSRFLGRQPLNTLHGTPAKFWPMLVILSAHVFPDG